MMPWRLGAKESADAKAKGLQDELDMSRSDATFLQVLYLKKKLPKYNAGYNTDKRHDGQSCVKCKFNLGDERKCHIIRGKIDNEKGISAFFSPKGDGMLPGDIVWMYVKEAGKKLKYKEGYVINEGSPGFQCKDCKYYLYSENCLLIEGKFRPKQSCGFIVKVGNGTKV
jgi:hypothetical protein